MVVLSRCFKETICGCPHHWQGGSSPFWHTHLPPLTAVYPVKAVFLLLRGPQDQVLESQCHRNEHWTEGKECGWSLLEITCVQGSRQERELLLSERVLCKTCKGIFPKGEGLGFGKHSSIPRSLSAVVSFQWTRDNPRMPFSMVDILLGLLENRNTCASRL